MKAGVAKAIITGGVLLVAAACNRRTASQEARPYPDAPSVAHAPCPVGGVWEVWLALEADPRRRITGWIAITDSAGDRFVPSGRGDRTVATWKGKYQIPMERLLWSGETGMVPPTAREEPSEHLRTKAGAQPALSLDAALLPTGDSAEFVLTPELSHPEARLRGALRGDSITGDWWKPSPDPGAPHGRFTMVRREGCAKS